VEELVIAVDDPRNPEIREVLDRHLAFARASTPHEHVHALDLKGLLEPSITFFSARAAGKVVGVGALKRLDREHVELKSMHTVEEARGLGVGRAMISHLLAVAAERGARRVSVETGTSAGFEPARRLYASVGFVPCEPFGEYAETSSNFFMTSSLVRGDIDG
jgi:putative acetyltransferase